MNWTEMTPVQRDALIAEKIMGLRVYRYPAMEFKKVGMEEIIYTPETPVITDERGIVQGKPAPYSTDMNAAWQIIKHMAGIRNDLAHGSMNETHENILDHFASVLLSEGDISPASSIFPLMALWSPGMICKVALRAYGLLEDE